MDTREFAYGYRDFSKEEQEAYIPIAERQNDAELETAFETPRIWNEYFSTLTYEALQGVEVTPAHAQSGIKHYTEWHAAHFADLYEQVQEAATRNPDNHPYLGELTFHLMAPYVEAEWRMLTDPEYQASIPARRDEQSRLAVTAAWLIQQRQQLETERRPENASLISYLNGQITELDTMIALLEVAKNNPQSELVVVPGARRFESMRSHKNSDMLVIDRAQQEARGIQAKTSIRSGSYADRFNLAGRYDPQYVTLIDGTEDLGNTADTVYEYEGGLRTYTTANPGYISMEHLMRTPLKKLPGYSDPWQHSNNRQAKQTAKEMMELRAPYLAQAAKNIGIKVERDLYAQKSVRPL